MIKNKILKCCIILFLKTLEYNYLPMYFIFITQDKITYHYYYKQLLLSNILNFHLL